MPQPQVQTIKMVKLYYLGGLTNPKRKVTVVGSFGRVFALPPVGQPLVVEEFIARDLIARNKIGDKETKQVYECFTTDGRFAQRVAAGENPYAPSLTRDQVLQSLTEDEIATLLEKRGKSIKTKTTRRKREVPNSNELNVQGGT